jgi:hypothetical protein
MTIYQSIQNFRLLALLSLASLWTVIGCQPAPFSAQDFDLTKAPETSTNPFFLSRTHSLGPHTRDSYPESHASSDERGTIQHPKSQLGPEAERFFQDSKLQEALWISRESGNQEGARELERDLRGIMESDNYRVRKAYLTGKTPKIILDFRNGIKALFKPTPNPKSRYAFATCERCEVAAYRLDRVLEFDIVPMTVLRTIRGVRGSAQYFIQERKENLVPGVGKFTESFNRMAVFDYIVGNSDRHEDNWLYWVDQDRVIAIDHGLSFRWMVYAYEDIYEGGWRGIFVGEYTSDDRKYKWERTQSQDVSEVIRRLDWLAKMRLLGLSSNEIRQAIRSYVDADDLARVLKRFENVKYVLNREYWRVENTWVPRAY